jgi:hypothetical protein
VVGELAGAVVEMVLPMDLAGRPFERRPWGGMFVNEGMALAGEGKK